MKLFRCYWFHGMVKKFTWETTLILTGILYYNCTLYTYIARRMASRLTLLGTRCKNKHSKRTNTILLVRTTK